MQRLMLIVPLISACDTARLEPLPEPEPEPGLCEVVRAPLALQLGSAVDDDVVALFGTSERLWIGGYEGGRLGDNVEPSGDARAFVRALDVTGAVRAEWTIDSAQADAVEALVDAGAARPLVVGRTRGALRGPSRGDFDGFVARLGDDGAVDVTLQFGGDGPERPRSMTRFGDGWLIGGTDDLFIPTNYVERWSNPMFAVVDGALGDAALSRWDTVVDDVGVGATTSPDHPGAIFTAWFASAGPTGGTHVTRHDASGAVIWDAQLTTIGVDGVAAIAYVDGAVVVTGSTFARLGDEAFGGQDGFVA